MMFVSVFSGDEGIEIELRALDFSLVESWDIRGGKRYDLTVWANVRRLYITLESGLVAAVWWATPCHSWSTARRWDGGPPPLRDMSHLEGLPGLSSFDQMLVDRGNALADVTAQGMRIGHAAGAANVLENPSRSMLFFKRTIVEASRAIGAKDYVTDFCGFGTPWQKRTRLRGTLRGMHALVRKCRGGKICSFTHHSHVVLKGRDQHGVYLTQRAQPYPRCLCALVARVVRDGALAGTCLDDTPTGR